MKKTNSMNDVTSVPIQFFVSPQGNDRWSGRSPQLRKGTQDGPLATLEGARNAIRRFKAEHGVPAEGIRVQILPGVYETTQSFVLTPEDSGEAYAPIVYAGSAADKVIFRGGKALSGFKSVKDPAILKRLPAAAHAHVVQVNLNDHGIRDYGTFKSRGFSRPLAPAALELFYNNVPMTLARWPNVDYTEITDIPRTGTKNDGWGTPVAKVEEGFVFVSDRLKKWQWPQDIWIHGYWCWDWANSYERIAHLNPASGRIKTAKPYGMYGFRKGQRFFFQNILEELDSPGEWYLDRDTGVLYFWPPGPLHSESVVVSLMETPMISIDGASYVTFEHLTFEACRAQAITMRQGTHNRIASCILRNIGTYAITIDQGDHHQVEGCEISYTGDGGIHLTGGDRKQLIPCHHSVENCHIHHFSRWSKCYCPAILAGGVGMAFRHNRLHDAPHTAILFTGNEFHIENNEIYQVCMETGDAGAIYTGRDFTYRGNIARHNFIHHMGGVGMGTMGIYNDDCVSGTKMIGNIFYRATRAAMLGGGRDFLVENNLFVECEPAISFDSRGVSPHPNWQKMVNETMRDRLADMNYLQPPYITRYPELKDITKYMNKGKGVPPEKTLVRRNICLGGTWIAADRDAKRCLKASRNWIASGPLPAITPDLIFRYPSKAIKETDFKPIVQQSIGLQETAARSHIPPRRLVTALLEVVTYPVRSAKGKIVPGSVRVTIENRGQATETGRIHLALQIPGGLATHTQPAPLSYTLRRGQKHVRHIPIKTPPQATNVRLSYYFPGDTCFRQTLDVAVLHSWEITSLPRIPTTPREIDTLLRKQSQTFLLEKRPVAQIGLWMTPQGLCLAGKVQDRAVKVASVPWEKSCLEIFFATPEEKKIHQLVMVPPSGKQRGRSYRIDNGAPVPCRKIALQHWLHADGYSIQALIPLELAGLTHRDRRFRIESQLTAKFPGTKDYRHITLFGSTQAFRSIALYALASVRVTLPAQRAGLRQPPLKRAPAGWLPHPRDAGYTVG
jgi:hypothetical protein